MRVGFASRVRTSLGPCSTPQQSTLPLTTAQLAPSPAAIWVAPLTPAILAGVGDAGRLSSGFACPLWLPPQHQTSPLFASAQVCGDIDDCERAICTSSGRPTGVTGAARFSVVPSPSWPASLVPQQRTPPFSRIAQAWYGPIDSERTAPSPSIGTGFALRSFTFGPSWPRLLVPQHLTA